MTERAKNVLDDAKRARTRSKKLRESVDRAKLSGDDGGIASPYVPPPYGEGNRAFTRQPVGPIFRSDGSPAAVADIP